MHDIHVKIAKLIPSQEQFIITHYFRVYVNSPHPVRAQNCPLCIQKLILTCQKIFQKGYVIMMKNVDFF